MSPLQQNWAPFFDAWDDATAALWKSTVDTYTATINAVDPEQLADDLQSWVEGLDELAEALMRWRQLAEQLPPAERDAALAERAPMVDLWREFSAGFWPFVDVDLADGQQGPKQVLEGIGLAPVVLVVAAGSLAISVVAAAYAVGRLADLGEALATAYTVITELEARVLAMQSGLTLQPSTLPPPPPDEGAGSGVMVVGGLLVLGLLGGAVWAFTRSR